MLRQRPECDEFDSSTLQVDGGLRSVQYQDYPVPSEVRDKEIPYKPDYKHRTNLHIPNVLDFEILEKEKLVGPGVHDEAQVRPRVPTGRHRLRCVRGNRRNFRRHFWSGMRRCSS